MNREDIIRMAREAGLPEAIIEMTPIAFERFAALVAEHEREHGIKLLLDVLIDAAVKAEREACAKVCDELAALNRSSSADSMWQWGECAAAIRARGQE